MKTLSFELTMPNVGSWNGKWTGSDKKYFVIRKLDNETADKIMKDAKSTPIYEGFFQPKLVGYSPLRENYYYNFGDGWGANICVEQVDAKEASRRRKKSIGFYGYEWMVDSIIRFGDILNDKQHKEKLIESN
jgi:hypothetical protein